MRADLATTSRAADPPEDGGAAADFTFRRRSLFGWLRRHALAVVVLPVLVIVLYAPTVGYDFVNWDDPWYVTENPLVQGWTLSNLYGIATGVVIRNYAPLTIFSYLLDHTWFGLWPGGYHLTNLLLHALNAILVYALISQVTGRRFVAWATAALFSVHPVHIESVVWIASRKGLLSTAFILAALICWLRPKRTASHEGWGIAFLALALLSKVIAICVPPVVLLYDVLVQRRKVAEALPRQVIPGFLALWLLTLNMSAQTSELGGVRSHMSLGKLQILAVDSTILWQYVGMLAVPRDLCVLYDPPTSGIAAQVALSIAGWVLVAAFAFRVRRRWPLVPLALLTALLFLLPVINLFPLTTLMNDRYLYLPSIPLFALAAAAVELAVCRLSDHFSTVRGKLRSGLAYGLVVAAVAAYAMAAREHLPVWRNGMALWQHAAARAPQLSVVQIQRANSLHQLGQDEQAIAALEYALRQCEPDQIDQKRILQKLHDWRGGEAARTSAVANF